MTGKGYATRTLSLSKGTGGITGNDSTEENEHKYG
jgi:hypothetical protein